MNVHHCDRLCAKLEDSMDGRNTIPAISKILKCGVHWVARLQPVGVSEYGPHDQPPSDTSDEQSKISSQCPSSLRLKSKVDTKVVMIVGMKTGMTETDGVKG